MHVSPELKIRKFPSWLLQNIVKKTTFIPDYSFTFPPLSIARCSFTSIELSELGRRGENENSTLGNSSKGDSKPGSLT